MVVVEKVVMVVSLQVGVPAEVVVVERVMVVVVEVGAGEW